MKTSLQHLPQIKQQELQLITEAIVNLVNPEMIILFGSFSRGNWVDDTYKENGTTYTYKSDFDILVVTTKAQDAPPGFEKKVRRKISRIDFLQTPLQIIFHDIKFLNKELEDGNYFFAEIVKEGTILHNTNKFEFAQPKILTPAERAQKAQSYFDVWFKAANQFFDVYEYSLGKDYLAVAAFQLHQAAERYYHTIALVFTDYKPKIHDLVQLNKEAGSLDVRFKTVFPNQTDEEKRLFEILVKAYIDSRYKLGYTVSATDLEWLASRVQKLKELTETVCGEKVGAFGEG